MNIELELATVTVPNNMERRIWCPEPAFAQRTEGSGSLFSWVGLELGPQNELAVVIVSRESLLLHCDHCDSCVHIHSVSLLEWTT